MLANPFALDATGLLVWGAVAHAIADWPLQTDWMARHKAEPRMKLRKRLVDHAAMDVDAYQHVPVTSCWDRHPAAYVHAGVHLVLLLPVFGLAAVAIAVAHLVIDTRTPVAWWSRWLGQTQPLGDAYISADAVATTGYPHGDRPHKMNFDEPATMMTAGEQATLVGHRLDDLERELREWTAPAFDMGTLVRMNVDQVAHLATLAAAALVIGALS